MANKTRVLTLRLQHPEDLFVLPQTDLLSEYRNYLTGVELLLSELRSREMRAELELRLLLPEDQITDGLARRIEHALGRYCNERIHYNRREKRSLRLDGTTSFRIGVPVTAVGLLLTLYTARMEGDASVTAMVDHLGWVLAWIGLWWPLDTILFTPHTYTRENKALSRLADARVTIDTSTRSASLVNPLSDL